MIYILKKTINKKDKEKIKQKIKVSNFSIKKNLYLIKTIILNLILIRSKIPAHRITKYLNIKKTNKMFKNFSKLLDTIILKYIH